MHIDNDGNINLTTDDITGMATRQTEALEAEALGVQATGDSYANLIGGMLGVDPADALTSLAAPQTRRLAAAKFALEEARRRGEDTTFVELGVRQSAAELVIFGGDPSLVEADHVLAWVHPPEGSDLTYGFTAVPVTSARFDPDTGRWEADYADVASLFE